MPSINFQSQHSLNSHQTHDVGQRGWGSIHDQRSLLAEAEVQQFLEEEFGLKDRKNQQELLEALQKTQATSFADKDFDAKDLLKMMAAKFGQKETGKALIMDAHLEQAMREIVEEMAEFTTFGDEAGFIKDRALEQGAQHFQSDRQRREQMSREKHLKDVFKELPHLNSDQQAHAQLKLRKRVQKTPPPMTTPTAKQMQDALTQYLTHFSEGIVRDDKLKKEKARQTRDSLITQGISSRRIAELESSVRKVIRQDLKRKLKDSFIQLALSYDSKAFTQETMMHSQTFNMLAEQAGLRGVFGAGRDSIKDLKEDAKDTLKTVVTDELDSALMSSKVQGGSAEDLVQAFNRFNDLADIARFDADEYMKFLNQKLKDWGMTNFNRPDVLGVLDTDLSSDSQGEQQSSQQHKTDIDVLEDDIRALFVQRMIRGSFRHYVQSSIELQKLVKQMKRKGVYTEERLDDLRQEGESFARFRLYDLVRESLEERAALTELKGPAFRLVQQKYKHAMKRLRALDSPIPVSEVRVMRDKINEEMFSIIREEFLIVEARLKSMKTDVYLIKKRKNLLRTLKRLKKESKISMPIRPNGQTAVVIMGENNIVEAA